MHMSLLVCLLMLFDCVPSVMEMPNLDPQPIVRPDYIFADSQFVLSQSSVRRMLRSPTSGANRPGASTGTSTTLVGAIGEVISPGVNVGRRQQLAADKPAADSCLCHDASHCRRRISRPLDFSPLSRLDRRCGEQGPFVIGMVSRLSPEKSVGLFLLAASDLVKGGGCSDCVFVIIGDGPLGRHLQELATRLGISRQVRFMGWVHKDDIPGHLVGWDVAVTTGAWRETFSMVGIDHMAMGVPLVTFAAGGMGEYVADPADSSQQAVQVFLRMYGDRTSSVGEERRNPFQLSANAVVVSEASAEALSAALVFMMYDNYTRSSIAYEGLQTVLNHFSSEKTVSAYVRLFSTILGKREMSSAGVKS